MHLNILGTICVYAFPPFALQRQVLSRVILSTNLSLVPVAPLWFRGRGLQSIGFCGGRTSHAFLAVGFSSSASRQEILQGPGVA